MHSPIVALEDYLLRYTRRKAAFSRHAQDSPRRARRLLDELGAPDKRLLVVRVVGTKGKGSTAAMLESVLRAAGYRTGLYTSPHLHSPRERIQVDGQVISRSAFSFGLRQIIPLLEKSVKWSDLGPATLFEGLTALALAHLARYGVQVAVVEAGMGGKLDATHALSPLLVLLTPIALDHQAYLGDTLEAIATDKAAAIPPEGLALSAPQATAAAEVIQKRCREVKAELHWSGSGELSGLGLYGPHQVLNARLALAAVTDLNELGWNVSAEAVEQGLRTVRWPGRLEVVAGRPLTIVDAAHNPAAAQALAAALEQEFRRRPRILLLGCSADKDLAGITAALAPLADGVVLARAHHHRAAAPEQLAMFWQRHNVPVEVIPDVGPALRRARSWAGPGGTVCACGSFFVVAEVRESLGLAVREEWPEPVGGSRERGGSRGRRENKRCE